MFCSISGEVPQEPVVSKKSGLLFEKRLIEKYIIDQGKCPVTGEDLTAEELLPIQANKAVRPRPISGSSIPGLLVAFQNEWDEVMLETFTLKQHLDTTRQELAQALYQHDAACRVIARLMQERDLARQQLATLQAQGFVASDNSEQAAMNVDSSQGNGEADTGKHSSEKETVGQLVDEAVQDLVGTCGELSAARKARKGPAAPVAPSKEAVKGLEVRATHTPHKADSKTSISCVALHANFPISVASTGKTGSKRGKAAASSHAEEAEGAATGAVVLSGSTDKNVLLTQLETGRVLAKLAGHSKKVTAVSFHCTASTATSSTSTALFSASADATVKMWSSSGDDAAHYSEAWSYGGHDQEVHSLCMHPSGKYVVSVGSDGWHFLDVLREGAFLQGTKNAQWSSDPAARYSCGAFHPDGLILGTGSAAGSLRIWDVRTLENPHSLAGHAGAAMTCLAFSENGYQAASGGADGSVHLWDLRKLAFTQTLQLGDGAVGGVAFDQTGTFLAMGGAAAGDAARLQVRVVKDWSESADLSSAHSKAVMGVAWPVAGDSAAAQLVSCGADRSIKVFGAAAV